MLTLLRLRFLVHSFATLLEPSLQRRQIRTGRPPDSRLWASVGMPHGSLVAPHRRSGPPELLLDNCAII
jgi:hypothetical protein